MSSSLDERANLSNLSNVANEILIDEINQKDGVFRDEKIDRVGNILVGEKVSNFLAWRRMVLWEGGARPGYRATKSWIIPSKKSLVPALLLYSTAMKVLILAVYWGAIFLHSQQQLWSQLEVWNGHE